MAETEKHDRLRAELARLYLLPAPPGSAAGAQDSALVSPSGTVRALVLELVQPPGWEVLARIWHGVQNELDLPAPAIAVSGLDALQLWFSLEEPVAAARGHAFLEGLQRRYLADVDTSRVRLRPAPPPSPAEPFVHTRLVPALQEQTGNWSAFLAVDLVAIFADTPWLDIPPGEDGQAPLLQGLRMIEPSAFEAVLDRLSRAAQPVPASVGTASGVGGPQGIAHPRAPIPDADPRQFLTRVMQDASAPLGLRIEAAKALLHHEPNQVPQNVR
jgi:hypothetical protein